MSPDPSPDAAGTSIAGYAQLATDFERLFGAGRLHDPAVQEQLKVSAAGVSRVLAEQLGLEETPPMTSGA